jgi:hypothetical protein
VFHEKCLLTWFAAQNKIYLDQFQDRDERESLLMGDEMPAECPTCRTECFLDDETGKLAIHRLYINFGGDGMSSQIGSSPGPSSHAPRASTRTDQDREVLGLAKRAKSIGQELKALSADSTEADVEGALKRAEGLREDMASVKAIQGIKVSDQCVCSLRWLTAELRRWPQYRYQRFAIRFGNSPAHTDPTRNGQGD